MIVDGWARGVARVLGLVGYGAAVCLTVAVIGSALILSDTTGYYLSGLVSGAGFALIGAWLFAFNRWMAADERLVGRLPLLGMVTGAVMMLGLVGVPGIAAGVDDMDSAPAYTFVAGVGWFGTYLLFPAWAFLLSRTRERQQPGPVRDRSGL